MLAIVAHTKRAEQAHHLMETVGAAYMTIDNGQLKAEGNHLKAWTWLNNNSHDEWSIVLEDDAVPVHGFRQQLNQALATAPTPTVVSLYMGRKRPPHWQNHLKEAASKAVETDACWITGTHLLHGVGIAIKTELIGDMLTHTTTTRYPWDYRVAAWALNRKHPIHYTWPSLVEHADTPSVITQHPDKMPRTPGRTAWCAAPRQQWNSNAIQLRSKT